MHIHFAPPCGTALRARNKPVPRKQRAQGAPQPPPLRSAAFPEGLPDLWIDPIQLPFTQGDRVKVEGANTLYAFVAKLAQWCIEKDVGFSIENPANSWFWQVPSIGALANDQSVRDVCFTACRHGGRRPNKCR